MDPKDSDEQKKGKYVDPEFSLHIEPETVMDRVMDAIGTVLGIFGKAGEGTGAAGS